MAKTAAKKPAPSKQQKARSADWDAIERDFRTGKFTFRELEAKHGVNNATIARRAKREGWKQDLTDAVRQATNAALVAEIVQQECSGAQQNAATAVLAAAEVNKQVILAHRGHIGDGIKLVKGLLGELVGVGASQDELSRIAEIAGGDDPSEAMAVMRKVTSVHARTQSAKTLADAIDKLIRAERLAFGIDDQTGKPPQDRPPASKFDYTDEQLLAIAAGRSS